MADDESQQSSDKLRKEYMKKHYLEHVKPARMLTKTPKPFRMIVDTMPTEFLCKDAVAWVAFKMRLIDAKDSKKEKHINDNIYRLIRQVRL
jgi:hypothetical protein